LLGRFWLGQLPVDPFALARALGVRADCVELDDDTFGALIKSYGQVPKIVVNAGNNRARRRFTCAHELGHYARRGDKEEQYETVDYRSTASINGRYSAEIYADEFAACLLMPEAEVRALHEEGLFDWEMAKRFAVSRSAMRRRLRRLGLS